MSRILLDPNFDKHLGYDDELSLSVVGISNNIQLAYQCYCVDRGDDFVPTAKEGCSSCNATGIVITDNGKSIISLMNLYKETL